MTKEILHLSNLMQAVQNATQSDVEPFEDEYVDSLNQRLAFVKDAAFELEKELKKRGLFKCYHPNSEISSIEIGDTNDPMYFCNQCYKEV